MRFASRTPREYLARARAWISLLLLAPLAAAALFSRPYFAFNGMSEYAIEAAALVLFFTGLMIRWWATLFIGGRKDDELVTQGAYSVCRNPLYLGTLLMTLSVGVFLQSLSLLAGMAVVGVLYLVITIPVEERRLREFYGDRFDDYCRRVPCFFPNFGLHMAPAELNVKLNGIRAEFKRSLQYLSIPILCYLVEHLRMLPDWPMPLTLP